MACGGHPRIQRRDGPVGPGRRGHGAVRLVRRGAFRPGRLLLVLHHLVVDGVSWRILLPDLAAAWARVRAGEAAELAGVATSVRRWTHALAEEACAEVRTAELGLWQGMLRGSDPHLGTVGRIPRWTPWRLSTRSVSRFPLG